MNDSLILLGTEEPKIEFLKGGQWGDERLQRMFKGAKWKFECGGSFNFIPSPFSDVRSDLFPIPGTYLKNGEQLELQGEIQSPLGASASIDGFIHIEKSSNNLDIIYTVSALSGQQIAKVSQILSKD